MGTSRMKNWNQQEQLKRTQIIKIDASPILLISTTQEAHNQHLKPYSLPLKIMKEKKAALQYLCSHLSWISWNQKSSSMAKLSIPIHY